MPRYEIERKEKERAQAIIAEYEAQIEALKREVARLNGILAIDGTNSGTPTSKTPINKEKVIPNARVRTGRKRGGQPGHPKAKLKGLRTKRSQRRPCTGTTDARSAAGNSE